MRVLMIAPPGAGKGMSPASAGRGQHALKLESLIPAGQSDFELPACESCREALEDPGAADNADGGNGGS